MTAVAEAPAPAPEDDGPQQNPAWKRALLAVRTPFLALVAALAIGGLIIVATNPDTRYAWARFLNDPVRAITRSWSAVWAAYSSLFQGAFGSVTGISDTLVAATPLTLAGLAVAFAFKAGMFNIGGSGQFVIGSLFASYIGFTFNLPLPLHIALGLIGGFLGGALWGGIAGTLKATTGAHEVISTIMLNFIAFQVLSYALTTEVFLRPGRRDPVARFVKDTARLPEFIAGEKLDLGFVVAVAAVFVVWFILNRSTLGFQIRAMGANPDAATYAGMHTRLLIAAAMAIAGGLAGLAGAVMTLDRDALTGVPPTVGFTAIAVALLGKSNPFGVLAAAILFGALSAGARRMELNTQTPQDVIGVIQALIIVFVAAPALVRRIFRIQAENGGTTTFTTTWGKS